MCVERSGTEFGNRVDLSAHTRGTVWEELSRQTGEELPFWLSLSAGVSSEWSRSAETG